MSLPNDVGVGAGVGPTFAEDGGKSDVAREEIAGAAATESVGGGDINWVVSGGPEVSIKPFVPVEMGTGSDVVGGAG